MLDWLAAERRHTVVQLQAGLAASGCVTLLGEFRMGKTLTLYSLRAALRPPRVYISLVNLKDTELSTSDEQFYQQILQGLAEDWDSELPEKVQLAPPARDTIEERYDWFEAALEQLARRPITILIDDAEKLLADYSSWGKTVFRKLPQLMVRTNNNIRVALAGTPHLKQRAEALGHRTGGKAGLWDLVQRPIVLLPLSLQTVQDTFIDHEPLAWRLIELCGGHPHCLWQLTKNLALNEPTNQLLDAIEEQKIELVEKCDPIFRHYWQAYDHLTRQICFLLTVAPGGLKSQTLQPKLGRVSVEEVEHALSIMINTGVLFADPESQSVRLIELFRRWYSDEVGVVENVRIDQPLPPTPASPPAKEIPITELTFFPDNDLVLIRRDRFLYRSKLGITPQRLSTFRTKVRRVPANDGNEFFKNLQLLSEDLWAELRGQPWFEEIIRSVDQGHRLRFNIPVELGEFPFELLPLDETGTRRIGMHAAISRQLFKEGRYVDRLPLALPRTDKKRLHVLVVAAEAGGEITIDANGRIHRGEREIGKAFRLAKLRLDKEVEALHRIFIDHPDLIDEVTFLTNNYRINDTKTQGVYVHSDSPTAETFQALLKDPHKQFDIIHFIGHGLAMRHKPLEGGLLFDDRLVHLTDLAGLLRAQQQLGFVYLSCCDSGELDTDARTSDLVGLAHACIEARVPAVIGMRWRINRGASFRLTNAFYPAFFQAGTLDQALNIAMRQVYDQERDTIYKVHAEAPMLIMH